MSFVAPWMFVAGLAAALGVVVTRNPVHSALCLVLAFFSSAAIWLLVSWRICCVLSAAICSGAM